MAYTDPLYQDTPGKFVEQFFKEPMVLTTPRIFIDICDGDIEIALFLSQCYYWLTRGKRSDGFFWKSDVEWLQETGLTHSKLIRARKMLKSKDLITIKKLKAEGSPTLHYKVNCVNLYKTMMAIAETDLGKEKYPKKGNRPEIYTSNTDPSSETMKMALSLKDIPF
jgi:hypothetical protein